jgi:hypothetical protein
MMKYEGVKKIETIHTVERITTRVEDIAKTIADILSSLTKSNIDIDSVYEMLYLACIYCKDRKMDSITYINLQHLKENKELASTVHDMLKTIQSSFYFIYVSYSMYNKDGMACIRHKYYIVDVINNKKEQLTIRVTELNKFEGTSVGRILKR